MNGRQARLLLDGAFAFTEHIPLTMKQHRKRADAYTILKEIINEGYEDEYPTQFEKYEHPEEWAHYKEKGVRE